MTKLTREQSQKTITKRMIRNCMTKLTNYAYDTEIRDSIAEVVYELDNSDDFQEMCYYDRISTREYLCKNTSRIEDSLREKGLRIWGDKLAA
jgi:hypothetical protein